VLAETFLEYELPPLSPETAKLLALPPQ